MSARDRDELRRIFDDARAYLQWQKRLGHPGVPRAMIEERMKMERESLRPEANVAPRRSANSPPPASKASAPASEPAEFFPAASASTEAARPTLESIREELGDCRRCKLWEGRQNIVFGEGDPNADILFVGEGPGADEDAQGRPFIGRAGQLLTRWIELGMGIPRKSVYIGNIVKCRPPNNRDPEKDEVAACIDFIKRQIRAVNPRVLILLGRVPMTRLLGVRDGITKVHGTWYRFEGVPTMPIFHPSYCLRPPQDEKKRLVWGDLKKVLAYLDMPVPTKKK